MPLVNLVWAAPLQIVVATYFLIAFLGMPETSPSDCSRWPIDVLYTLVLV